MVTKAHGETAPDPALWHGTDQHTRDQERRQRLLDAALELYGTIGYQAATVQAVCQLAKVSTRSFYELYPDQEALLMSLYLALNGEVLDAVTDVTVDPAPDVFTVARRLVDAALGPMLRDERKARVLEVEAVGVSAAFERQRRTTMSGISGAIDTAFEALAAAGLIAAAPGGLASLILVGGITEALVQRVQGDPAEREPSEAFLDEVTRVIVSVTESR